LAENYFLGAPCFFTPFFSSLFGLQHPLPHIKFTPLFGKKAVWCCAADLAAAGRRCHFLIGRGWQTAPLKGVTLPHFLQANFISATIGAQT
jgi:hypothetical protein